MSVRSIEPCGVSFSSCVLKYSTIVVPRFNANHRRFHVFHRAPSFNKKPFITKPSGESVSLVPLLLSSGSVVDEDDDVEVDDMMVRIDQ